MVGRWGGGGVGRWRGAFYSLGGVVNGRRWGILCRRHRSGRRIVRVSDSKSRCRSTAIVIPRAQTSNSSPGMRLSTVKTQHTTLHTTQLQQILHPHPHPRSQLLPRAATTACTQPMPLVILRGVNVLTAPTHGQPRTSAVSEQNTLSRFLLQPPGCVGVLPDAVGVVESIVGPE